MGQSFKEQISPPISQPSNVPTNWGHKEDLYNRTENLTIGRNRQWQMFRAIESFVAEIIIYPMKKKRSEMVRRKGWEPLLLLSVQWNPLSDKSLPVDQWFSIYFLFIHCTNKLNSKIYTPDGTPENIFFHRSYQMYTFSIDLQKKKTNIQTFRKLQQWELFVTLTLNSTFLFEHL